MQGVTDPGRKLCNFLRRSQQGLEELATTLSADEMKAPCNHFLRTCNLKTAWYAVLTIVICSIAATRVVETLKSAAAWADDIRSACIARPIGHSSDVPNEANATLRTDRWVVEVGKRNSGKHDGVTYFGCRQ